MSDSHEMGGGRPTGLGEQGEQVLLSDGVLFLVPEAIPSSLCTKKQLEDETSNSNLSGSLFLSSLHPQDIIQYLST